jgi:hypothetical protein
MALITSSRLGAYEILAQLGAGGMGEVYRAKDTKLGREVALKILPATFTNDPERLARFRREAQVLASLNHPHIGAIYDLDEANGTQYAAYPFWSPDSRSIGFFAEGKLKAIDWQVSVSGGVQPRWRRDGKELFFLATDRRTMFATPVQIRSGEGVDVGAPVSLFATRVIPPPNSGKHQYAVSPDEQRFLINIAIESATAPITLLLNWNAHG